MFIGMTREECRDDQKYTYWPYTVVVHETSPGIYKVGIFRYAMQADYVAVYDSQDDADTHRRKIEEAFKPLRGR